MAGAPVESTPEPAVDANHTPPDRRRRRFRVALGLMLMVLILLAIAGVSLRGQHQRVDRSLTTARSELHQTLDQLRVARSELATTNGQVDDVNRTLASDTALLTQDQTRLANSRTRNYLQGVDVSVLHICLAGVERALNQFALGDRTGAVSTLNGVTGACREATPAGS